MITVADHDTEDKAYWVKRALADEREFVERLAPRLGLDAAVNPDKRHDPTAIDLIVDGTYADLKCQRAPFFRASKYQMDPRWTVTFNTKDAERYRRYDDLHVYFWVRWETLSLEVAGQLHEVLPLRGVWRLNLPWQWPLVRSSSVHTYHRRGADRFHGMDERGNAVSSHLLDLRHLDCLGFREM